MTITVLDGWQFPEHGDYAWSVHPEQLDSTVPCLVVTGSPRVLAEARRRLTQQIVIQRDSSGKPISVEIVFATGDIDA